MPESLRTELVRIIQAIEIPTPESIVFAGQITRMAGLAAPAPGMPLVANPLTVQLQMLIYEVCYCQRFNGVVKEAATSFASEPGFVETLSAANASRERWDPGWQIQQTLPSGQIVVGKGAITRIVWPGEFHSHGPPGIPPGPGTVVSLFSPKESRTMQPGFYFAFGEALPDQQDEFGIVRLYWHVQGSGAARLLGGLTQALNRFRIPFRFKCLLAPGHFDRTDAAVLYVSKRYYRIAAELLVDLYRTERSLFTPATPLFTKQLADGLGFAEDPMNGESFGMNRCRLFAEGVCNAHAQGVRAPEAILQVVEAQFDAAGISLDRPFLNPGSVDRYEFVEH